MKQKFYDALSSAIYISRLTARGETLDTDDKRLRAGGLYPDWAAGSHQKGELYCAEGQVWECFQSYDNAVYPDITPGGSAWGTFNRPLHATAPETARDFVPPTGAHDIYRAGEYMRWADAIYLCKSDTAYSPAEYAQAWEVAG